MAVTFGPPKKEELEKKLPKDAALTKPSEKKPEGKEAKSETAKAKLEQLKPEFKDFTLYGVKILRERNPENNQIKFYEGTKDKRIASLQEWIKNKLNNAEKKKIEDSLKPYEALFKEVKISESEKQTRLKTLKDQCFQLHEKGKTPQKLEEIPANINLVLKKLSVSQFSVDASAEKITIPYAVVLPPHVTTIIVTRENPDTKQKFQIVCIKYGSRGNEHFLDAESGKPIFLKPGDDINIVAVTPPETAPAKAGGVSDDLKHTAPESRGGGLYGGGGSPAASTILPSETADKPKVTPKMTNDDISAAKKQTKETPENYGEGDFNVRKLENREFNGGRPIYLCTFPKKLDPNKKTRFILYFHGFGKSPEKGPDIFKNKEATGGLEKFSKDINENIIFVMPQGESNEPKAGNYFGETVSSQSRIENFINYSLLVAFDKKNPPETNVDKYLMGHSGANYAMEKALRNVPANYFKGIGLFDTLYSEGTGAKYANLLLGKHNKMDVYSIYRTVGGPGNNNPILGNAMATRSEGPKGHFETRSGNSDHSAMKYPGIPSALSYFTSKEGLQTPVQSDEPNAPKKQDQRTA